jgi:hypothetical protein
MIVQKFQTVFLIVYGAQNRFQGMNSASLCSLAGRYDIPIPPRFLAPKDCLKIPAPDEFFVQLKKRNRSENGFLGEAVIM